jgi:hypothetical protein
MLDLNRAKLSERPINQLINELIEGAEPASENYRQYLGASTIGSECLPRVARVLKGLLRRHGMRCVNIREIKS